MPTTLRQLTATQLFPGLSAGPHTVLQKPTMSVETDPPESFHISTLRLCKIHLNQGRGSSVNAVTSLLIGAVN